MKSRLFRKAMTSIIGAASALLLGGTILASAAPPQTVYNSPYISWSPDGQAWTLCRGDKNTKHYPYGTMVYTGISSSMPQPGIGEHYYRVPRTGQTPVETSLTDSIPCTWWRTGTTSYGRTGPLLS